jgi:hypothetical protein
MDCIQIYRRVLSLPFEYCFIPITPDLDLVLSWFMADLLYQLEYPCLSSF